MSSNHALVFGASGIIGWATTNAILEGYPTEDTFASVTALTNRPLSLEDSCWPDSPKLDIVSGIDILTPKGQEGLEADLKAKVKHVEHVTHVYFSAYIMDPDPAKEVALNVDLITRAVSAIEHLSPSLKFVVLPTGCKTYGVHLIDKFPFAQDLPLKESLPPIPEPHASQLFYYGQGEALARMSAGKPWTYCEVIPEVIIGFVPHNNVYCLAQPLAAFLALYAARHGAGSEVGFPGTERSWRILSNDSGQDSVAKTAIYASLHPERSSGQRYNAADSATPRSWRDKWPVVCEYFGLKGVGPSAGAPAPQPSQYLAEHEADWRALESQHGLKTGRVGHDRSQVSLPHIFLTLFDFDRQFDMTKCHDMMGDARIETDVKGAWWTAFDRFRKARIIP